MESVLTYCISLGAVAWISHKAYVRLRAVWLRIDRALTAFEKLAEPLPPYEVDYDTRPSKPIFAEPGFEDETVEQYEYRLAYYDTVRDAWVLDQARRVMGSRR